MELGDYKINVTTEAESKEVCALLEQLGISEGDFSGFYVPCIIATLNGYYSDYKSNGLSGFIQRQELSIPQLRDLVVLHRNDVSDANYSLFISTSQPTLELYKTSSDKFYVYAHGHHAWTESFSVGINTPNLKAITHSTLEQGLISGADALRALADGKEVEFFYRDAWDSIGEMIVIDHFMSDKFKFRLKPRTITLNIEIPAPFEPTEGEEFYVLSSVQPSGYIKTHVKKRAFLGAWKSEHDIQQVVSALRGALKNG